MRFKLLIMLIMILFLTGCKVEYQINLDENLNIEENIKLISANEQDNKIFKEFDLVIPTNKEIDDYVAYKKKLENLNYYNQTQSNELIEFNYKFNNEEYVNSIFVNSAYEFISVIKIKNEIVLSTSKEFLLFDLYDNLDEIKVTIKSKYKMIKSNADKEERRNYTWIITKENAYGKNIYLKLDTTKEDLTLLEKIKEGEYTNVFTISLALFLIGIIGYFIIKRKGDIRNEI